MNHHLIRMFENSKPMKRLRTMLPQAFEMAKLEMPSRNPAVGILREQILVGFFISEFGEDNVLRPGEGNIRGYDLKIHNAPLSINTVTGDNDIKVSWTVDQSRVAQEIKEYEPASDIFLVSIYWGECRDSIFYIPKLAQIDVISQMGRKNYINAKTGTNHRGIKIRNRALKKLKAHTQTLSAKVHWQTGDVSHQPHDRWLEYWTTVGPEVNGKPDATS